jgi:YVTN family beta-propeller protein
MSLRSTGFLLIAAMATGCSRSAERSPSRSAAYVSDEESGNVVVFDTNTNEVTARIPVGKRPRGLKVSRDGKWLYVALSGSPRAGPGVDPSKLGPPDRNADGIGVVDLATKKLVRTLKCGIDPESFDLSTDGKTLYVSNEVTAEMTVLDPSSGDVRARVPVGGEPEGVTIRPDGKAVYVTSEQDNQVTVIDTNTLTTIGRVSTGIRPRAVVFTSDGGLGFVTNEGEGTVTVFDAARNTPVSTITITQNSPTPSGPRPMGAVLARDGKQLYVTTGRGGSVAVIDVGTRSQVRSIDGAGNRPWGIALSRDGMHLYTANGTSNDVSFVNISTGNVDKRIQIGGLPWGVAVGF